MLNKEVIVQTLSEEHGITKRMATDIYTTIVNAVVKGLNEGGPVRLAGLGAMKVVDIAARTVKSPRTGEPVPVSARKRVRFVASAKLKRYLNGQ